MGMMGGMGRNDGWRTLTLAGAVAIDARQPPHRIVVGTRLNVQPPS